jgi:HEAT repeat protein
MSCLLRTSLVALLLSHACGQAPRPPAAETAILSEGVDALTARFGFAPSGAIDESAFQEALALGKEALPEWRRAYAASDVRWVRAEIAFVLGRSGAVAEDFLLEQLDDPDSSDFYLQLALLYALGKVGSGATVSALERALTSPDLRYQLKIEPGAQERFERLLNELGIDDAPTGPLRNDWIVAALGAVGTPEAVEILERLAERDDRSFLSPGAVTRALAVAGA